MSTAEKLDTSLSIWEGKEQIEQIRKIFAPKLTDVEFGVFVGLGKATGLNPYLKEIWAVKYKPDQPAQIFIGRDGYRKSAQRHPDYDYHHVDAVYSNDKFEVINGEVNHSYSLKDRGALLGGYCSVKRKSSSRSIFVYVPLNEYDTGRSTWSEKKSTMIKKVSEAQSLRMAFQEMFSGTYDQDEEWVKVNEVPAANNKGVNGLKKAMGMNKNDPAIEEAEVVEVSQFDEEEKIVKVEVEEEAIEFGSPAYIKLKIENSKSANDLIEAVDLVNSLTDNEAKKNLMQLFREKKKALG